MRVHALRTQLRYETPVQFRDITRYDFAKESLYNVMRREYGLTPTSADA